MTGGPSFARRCRLLLAVATGLITLLAPATSAGADGFGPETFQNGPIELPDDTGASYCFTASYDNANLQTWAHDAEIYLDNRTAAYRIFQACNGNDTDMIFWNADLPPGAVGLRTCHLGAYGVCVSGSVIIDAAEIYQAGAYCAAYLGTDPATTITGQYNKTIRHEVGHGQGLHHGNSPSLPCTHGPALPGGTDSMVSGVAFNSLAYFSYHDHHQCHINAWLVYGVWQNTCT